MSTPPARHITRFARINFLLVFFGLGISICQAQLLVERQRGGPMEYTGLFGPAAAYFDIYEPTRITAVNAWVNGSLEIDVKLSLEFFDEDGAHLSDRYSTSFLPSLVTGAPAKWQGTGSLAWDVQPGVYRIEFDDGFFPLAYGGPPSTAPQEPSGYEYFVDGEWEGLDFPFGVQIYGRPLSAVPEPATYGAIGALLLVGLVLVRRTRRGASPFPPARTA